MNTDDALQLAKHRLYQWQLGDWTVQLSSRMRLTLGICIYGQRLIRLSSAFVTLNTESEVDLTIKHEIAHALDGPGFGHGPVWKAKAIEIVARPIRCNPTAICPPHRWVAICPSCKRVFCRHRRPTMNRRCWCSRCGPNLGLLLFVENVYRFCNQRR